MEIMHKHLWTLQYTNTTNVWCIKIIYIVAFYDLTKACDIYIYKFTVDTLTDDYVIMRTSQKDFFWKF